MGTIVSSDERDRTIQAPRSRDTFPLMASRMLPAGTRLDEFELLEPVGEGGFGIVYRAFDHALLRQVAVKEYLPASVATRSKGLTVSVVNEASAATFAKGLASFANEARLLAQFDHPSLLKVYRVWEANGTAYIATPFYEGVTLKARLRTFDAPPDERWLLDLLDPLLDALAVLHAGQCVHRDISPDNILILPSGRPLLLDFGAARRVVEATQALTVFLKAGYAPLEQYSDSGTIRQGPWTDIYALAAVVRFAITGKPPTASVSRALSDSLVPLAQLASGRYSERFLRAIDHALAVQPDDRPQDVGALRALLDLPAATPRTQSPPKAPAPATELSPEPAKSRAEAGAAVPAADAQRRGPAASRVIAFVAAVALAAVAAFAYLLYQHSESPVSAGQAPSTAPAATIPAASDPRESTSPAPPAEPASTFAEPTRPAEAASPPAASAPAPAHEPPVERSRSQPAPPTVVQKPDADLTTPATPAKEERPVANVPVPSAAERAAPGGWPEQCTDIVQRASLGEPLTGEEQAILRRDCR